MTMEEEMMVQMAALKLEIISMTSRQEELRDIFPDEIKINFGLP